MVATPIESRNKVMRNLKTSRLVLRVFEPTDLPAIYRMMQQPEVGGICATIGRCPTEATAQAWIQKARDEFLTQEAFIYAIVFEKNVIGSMGVHLQLPEKTTAEIGYWLDVNEWGKGFALEACTAIIEQVLPTLPNIKRLIATTDKTNDRSGALLRKLSFTLTEETCLVKTVDGHERASFLYERRFGSYSFSQNC
jgi:RimJ/RimL family protein N-acetyltransferase